MSVTVSEAAQADATQAVRFYNSRPGKYGGAFRAEFRAAVRRVGAAPRQFLPVEDAPDGYEVREFLLERFGQRVIYRVDDGDSARVIAVVHASAGPNRWLPRVND